MAQKSSEIFISLLLFQTTVISAWKAYATTFAISQMALITPVSTNLPSNMAID